MSNEKAIDSHKQVSLVSVIIIAILAVSTASIFIRFAQEDVPSLVIAAWRLFLAAIILAPFVLCTNNRKTIKNISLNNWVFMGMAGVFLALHFASWITSLEYTSVASSVVLVTTAPIWVALLSPLFLKEKVNSNVIIGLILAMTGGIIVGISETCEFSAQGFFCPDINELWQGRALIGNLLALLGALFSASYLMIGRRARADLSLPIYTFLVYGVAAICLIIGVIITGESFFNYPSLNYVWFFGLAIIPQLIGHSTFNWALKFLPASYISVALLGEPIGSVVLAFLILRETPTIIEVSGAVFILIGILIASMNMQKSIN